MSFTRPYDDSMAAADVAPTPKRQRSVTRHSVRSLRIEKPLNSQISPKFYNHRRRTTPTISSRHSVTPTSNTNHTAKIPMAPPSCIFPFQSFHYERPSTWHTSTYKSETDSEGTSSFSQNPSASDFKSGLDLNPTTDTRISNPSNTSKPKSRQSAPVGNRLLFNEIETGTTWLDSSISMTEDLVAEKPNSTYHVNPANFETFANYPNFQGNMVHESFPLTQTARLNVQDHVSNQALRTTSQLNPPQMDIGVAASEYSQPRIPPTLPVDKDLVGVGLYDRPAQSQPTPINSVLISPVSTSDDQLGGKGLKLEETWQPPVDQVPEAEEDDGAESPEDEVPQPGPMYFTQQQTLVQEPEKLNQDNFASQTFFFDDDFDVNGTSWFQESGNEAPMPFVDFSQYGAFDNSYGFM